MCGRTWLGSWVWIFSQSRNKGRGGRKKSEVDSLFIFGLMFLTFLRKKVN